MRASQETLVAVARSKGRAVASSWSAYRRSGGSWGDHVAVFHYDTLMVLVHADNTVTPVSEGLGSMTDKCGIRKILSKVNGQGYRDIFGC